MIVKSDASPILLVIDDNRDPELSERLARHKPANPVNVLRCASARDALDYLGTSAGQTQPQSGRKPSCILLDLPGNERSQLLGKIKKDATLCAIPVIVISASLDQQDINACYRAGANACITKPQNRADLDRVISRLQSFMFDVTALPVVA